MNFPLIAGVSAPIIKKFFGIDYQTLDDLLKELIPLPTYAFVASQKLFDGYYDNTGIFTKVLLASWFSFLSNLHWFVELG